MCGLSEPDAAEKLGTISIHSFSFFLVAATLASSHHHGAHDGCALGLPRLQL
jgi:hypothetical protein